MKYYNRTNTCYRCGINFNLTPQPYREYNKERNWTGKWICLSCWKTNDYVKRQDSYYGVARALAKRRIGSLNSNSEQAKGDLFQELNCRWRSTISTIPVEDLNKKLDRYTTRIDSSRDSELGILQVQGRFFSNLIGANGGWSFGHFEREWDKEFDNMICYCASKDGKYIERIYIFLADEIIGRTSAAIVRNPSKGTQWYDKYRITDEEIINKVNDIWQQILKEKENDSYNAKER